MFHNILVAMDNSTMGKHVFNEALSLAKATGARLMLLHVLTPSEENYPEMPFLYNRDYCPQIQDDIVKAYVQKLEHGLNILRSRTDEATALGVSAEFSQIPGTPGHAICDLARTWGADLIVIGRRGLSGLKEAILGSVSNYVTHHAPCSVLTINQVSSSNQGTLVSET